jgi:hypothetical protein
MLSCDEKFDLDDGVVRKLRASLELKTASHHVQIRHPSYSHYDGAIEVSIRTLAATLGLRLEAVGRGSANGRQHIALPARLWVVTSRADCH